MKRLILIIVMFAALGSYAQTVVQVKPLNAVTIGSPVIDTIANDTSIYFRFTGSVLAYSVQLFVVDTIQGDSTGARLEGSNWLGGNFTTIGDSVVINKDQAVFTSPKVWTGTSFPYAIGRVRITDCDALIRGTLRIVVYSN